VKKSLILVAEDEEEVRNLLFDALNLIGGFDVVGVADGDEAVKEAIKIKPDLILLDVRMPNMTGFEACEILKADMDTQKIPVVFLSAYGQEAEVSTGLKLGAEAYFVKPFALKTLLTRITQILKKYGKV
jgi:two-component system alkaline phosphatase synthesis response regulator PhoP